MGLSWAAAAEQFAQKETTGAECRLVVQGPASLLVLGEVQFAVLEAKLTKGPAAHG